MSVYFYDRAIVERVRTILGDDRINIIPPEKIFTKSLEQNDNPILPAFSLYREGYSLSNLNRNMALYRGGRVEHDEGSSDYFQTQSLPITIKYQADVLTVTREQNDELTRELLWFFTLYPELKMTLTYEGFTRDVRFNVFVQEEITDNSEINTFEDKGQYYRTSFQLVVDEAQLFLVTALTPYSDVLVEVTAYDALGGVIP